jgi:hypothetical protein
MRMQERGLELHGRSADLREDWQKVKQQVHAPSRLGQGQRELLQHQFEAPDRPVDCMLCRQQEGSTLVVVCSARAS